jgi:hypothetical protein
MLDKLNQAVENYVKEEMEWFIVLNIMVKPSQQKRQKDNSNAKKNITILRMLQDPLTN